MTDYSEAIRLAKALMERQSVTPEDAGCQQLMADYLAPLGFTNETMQFEEVTNLWSIKERAGKPVFLFAGHTDVVPAGNLAKWHTQPFVPTEKNGYLYGRGAADMKASLAAMLVATRRFIEQYPEHENSIAFLITSDEEGPFINGTVRVVEALKARQQALTWCVVGEPSSTKTVGDTVKIGRRGSLTGYLTIHGQQGHVAYPHLANNAIHAALPALSALCGKQWDEGNQYFPPTSFQIANIKGGTGAGNVIPGEMTLDFNLRYSTEQTAKTIKDEITHLLDAANIEYDLVWKLNGEPFLTQPGKLIEAAQVAIRDITGLDTELSTAGGTSDGRFIAPTGCDVVELGPVNATIHQVNECCKMDDIVTLCKMYEAMLQKMVL